MVGYIPLGSSTQVTDWYLFKGLPNLNHGTKEEQLECVTLFIFSKVLASSYLSLTTFL